MDRQQDPQLAALAKRHPDEYSQGEYRKNLARLAKAVITDENSLGVRYVKLCEYIRSRQFTPADVSSVLKSVGFSRERISEIKRVSFTPDEIFNEFKKAKISFRLALDRAREGDRDKASPQQKWLKIFAAFERQVRTNPPKERFHSANGWSMVMFSQSEIPEGKAKEFTRNGWRVSVRRDVKTTPADKQKNTPKKGKKNEKDRSTSTVPVGQAPSDCGVSGEPSGDGQLS